MVAFCHLWSPLSSPNPKGLELGELSEGTYVMCRCACLCVALIYMYVHAYFRHYFALATNPGEQFHYFTNIAVWLLRKCGKNLEQPQEVCVCVCVCMCVCVCVCIVIVVCAFHLLCICTCVLVYVCMYIF